VSFNPEPEKKNMTLNVGQQSGADDFFAFLLSSQKEFRIKGPAGVGKTYLLQHLISTILPYYKQSCKLLGRKEEITAVVMTATTNRAAEVLSGDMGMETQTIHSFLNLKVIDDYDTGKQRIQKTPRFCVYENTLIFVDEASMTDFELYTILQEATTSTCKIVYVGDPNQLAPVGESLSRVFADPTMGEVILTEPVRNANQPALMALCQQLRETVETGIFKPMYLVPGVIDQLDGPTFERHVQTVFKDEGADSRILAYTNKQVISYNDYIRRFRGYTPNMLHDGELVVNNTAVSVTNRIILPAESEFRISLDGSKQQTLSSPNQFEAETYSIKMASSRNGEVYQLYQPQDFWTYQGFLKDLAKQKRWSDFFWFKNRIPDLRARDSSTVYKAQGSSFDSVYIDLQNIGTSNIANQVARMLYVAVSRAKEHVYFYGRLPDKYIGA